MKFKVETSDFLSVSKALERAHLKLSAYLGVCTGDKELPIVLDAIKAGSLTYSAMVQLVLLMQANLEAYDRYRKTGICSWCGKIFEADPVEDPKDFELKNAALLEHARNCAGHPAVQELARLKDELAGRPVIKTEWEKLVDQCEELKTLLTHEGVGTHDGPCYCHGNYTMTGHGRIHIAHCSRVRAALNKKIV